MNDIVQLKQKANELRKAKSFEEALPIYRSLWEETGDRFDGSGLLHCLRKLELFNEALPLADVLVTKYPDFDWCKYEVIWTYIQGMLAKLSEQEPLEKIIETANKIMILNPARLALRTVVFRVLKSAKSAGHWKIVNEWVDKISPDTLDTEPSETEFNKGGWSDQALWYNYKLRGLLERQDADEEEIKKAVSTASELSGKFPKQRRFFLRLSALGNHALGNLVESEIVYQNLCAGSKPDWWLLHEYGKVVRDRGKSEDALKLLCRAAISHSKLPSMVTLFVDIGMLYKDMDDNKAARAHLVLSRCIREKQGWTLPESMIDDISSLNQIIGDDKEPKSLEEALHICRAKWSELVSKDIYSNVQSRNKRTVKAGLIGKVSLGYSDRPFCFINTQDGQSFFCYKSDLPPNTEDGDEVTFDALPSFDKKKNKESWKASNVKHPT